MNSVFSILIEPYPDRDDLISILKSSFLGGFIVFFFLYAFQPFAIGQTEDIFLHCLMFGLISLIVSLLIDLTIRYVFKIRKDVPSWTFGKWILGVLTTLVFIAAGNYLYLSNLNGFDFQWKYLGMVIYTTFLVGTIPISIFGGLNLYRKLKQNQVTASNIPTSTDIQYDSKLVQLPVKNSTNQWTVDVSKVLYIEAMKNYVKIVFLKDNAKAEYMLRNTLINVERAIGEEFLSRCHRSFLVNKSKIEEVSGNAQGLKLSILDAQIPVSRKYMKEFN